MKPLEVGRDIEHIYMEEQCFVKIDSVLVFMYILKHARFAIDLMIGKLWQMRQWFGT